MNKIKKLPLPGTRDYFCEFENTYAVEGGEPPNIELAIFNKLNEVIDAVNAIRSQPEITDTGSAPNTCEHSGATLDE